jgi:cupin superfamily acireductone dioxygenase involved in methionine salvage
MILKDIFASAKANNVPAVLRNVFPTVPAWESFLNHLETYQKIDNGVRNFGPTYYVVELFDQDIAEITSTYLGYDVVYKELDEANVLGIMNRPVMLVSTGIDSPELPKHKDPCDQMHWTCVGKEFWKVWLSENEVLEFKLEPGDLIFIPVGLYHQVKSVTSRAGITWSANIA